MALNIDRIDMRTVFDEILGDENATKHRGLVEGSAIGIIANGGRGPAFKE